MESKNVSKIPLVTPSKKEIFDLNYARASGICSEKEAREVEKILNQ